jgi:hypothetical protein
MMAAAENHAGKGFATRFSQVWCLTHKYANINPQF